MTNHWIDMMNADVILIMGGNPAEDHPIAMNWLSAHQGARHLYSARRSALQSHQLDCGRVRKIALGHRHRFRRRHDQLCHRAQPHSSRIRARVHQCLVDRRRRLQLRLTGCFAGYDPQKRSYDQSRWAFALDGQGRPRRDPTLKHPRCVFQLLKQHFSRYTPESVCRITGTPEENYLRVCDLYTSTFAPDRAGTWLYAMGTAQHSHGTQNIRSYAILQLLLGNIGVAGGGVNAMRGESNVQGSTDQGLNCDGLPGYLRLPVERDADLKTYLSRVTPIATTLRTAQIGYRTRRSTWSVY